MFIEVQVMRQNTGNWEYTIKAEKVLVNLNTIKMIQPSSVDAGGPQVFLVYFLGEDVSRPTVIDKESYKKLKEAP
jgi:hypothetical protein